ncbi:MAG: glycoside hydrolase family 38 C-terminal domain-containing protein, partial [Ignavibacteriota bacterium]
MTNDLYMIGNAHLDPAWMWRLEEGFEAFLSTCRSALARIDETPDFIFAASSAAHYEFVERTDPVLFLKIQEAIKIGRWAVVGGWWVEADCNLPSGEALIRQGLFGQKYFQSRFGITCRTGFCIDSFGHNANIPALLQHCGMSRYVFMRPEEHEKKLGAVLFKWRSPSDEEVIAYRLPLHYSNFKNSVVEKLQLLPKEKTYNADLPWMLFYGVGNHGGGPTKEQIGQIISEQESNKDFRIHFGSPDIFFEEVEKKNISLEVVVDEMQPHAIGCYSAHSEIKKLHRRAENQLLRAEKFSILAESHVGSYNADWSGFDQAWKNILLNCFHDILGGVAIKEACDEAVSLYHESIAIAAREERLAIQALSNTIDTQDAVESLLVFNSHSRNVSAAIEFEFWHPQSSENGDELKTLSLTTDNNVIVSTQKIEASGKIGGDRVRFAAQVRVPAFGWTKLKIERNPEQKKSKSSIVAKENVLSNGICGIIFEGEPAASEILYSPAQVFADESDTWGHGINGFTEQKGSFKVTKVTVLERGPVRGRVRVESTYGNSRMEEDFILYEGADHIEQRVFLDWRKTNAVMKLRYAHGCTDPKIFYEIPYSVIERPVSKDEVPGGAWAFVQDDSRGLGIINDAKYSYSSDEKYFYLTCARSPLYAHHEPPHVFSQHEQKRFQDQGEQ